MSYDDDVHPYSDLALGRVDAVLLDNVLAERGDARNPASSPSRTAVAIGHYVGILAPEAPLRGQVDESCARRCATAARGDLPQVERLERRSAAAPTRVLSGRRSRRSRRRAPADHTGAERGVGGDAALPAVAAPRGGHHAGAVVRAMALAVASAGCIAIGRVYGAPCAPR